MQVHESDGQVRAGVQAFAQRLALDCTCENEHGLLPNLELYALGDHLRVHSSLIPHKFSSHISKILGLPVAVSQVQRTRLTTLEAKLSKQAALESKVLSDVC